MDDRTLLRRVWAAFGCALNPEDYQPTVRAAMWEQVISMAEESHQRSSRVYRENQQLERELAALRATASDDTAAQAAIDDHMRALAQRVIDVFEDADEDALAEGVMSDVFSAIGLLEAHGAMPGPDGEGSDRG